MSLGRSLNAVPQRVRGNIDPRELAFALAVFLGAFLFGMYGSPRVGVPYLEPALLVVALALVIGALVSSAPLYVRRAYRRSLWVGGGLFAGWWSVAVWRPEPLPIVLIAPVAGLVVATLESERDPSVGWAMAITSGPVVGATYWLLAPRVERFGSRLDFAHAALQGSWQARRLVQEASVPVFLFGIPLGIVAYLVGSNLHRSDTAGPEFGVPSRETVYLLAVAVLSLFVAATVVRLL